MKKIILAAILACGAILAFADNIKWTENFAEAQKLSETLKRPIFLLFTGSDWCPACIQMEKKIFSNAEFKKFAESKFVMFKADFPQKKAQEAFYVTQNRKLSERYGVEGFPTIVIVDAKGKALGEIGYIDVTPQEYIKTFSDFLNKLKK